MNRAAALTLVLGASVLLALGVAWATGPMFPMPELPEPHLYGTELISRNTEGTKEKAVIFPHWSHRLKYACRVCHFELEFALKTNGTNITEKDLRAGLYCGRCHDGVTAFDTFRKESCDRCHTGKITGDRKKFEQFSARLPASRYGNQIDWVGTLRRTSMEYSLFRKDEKPFRFNKELTIDVALVRIPPVSFPHEVHGRFFECSDCHPDIFNLKRHTTEHMSMDQILNGKFCGVCHGTVAFPIQDCGGCHKGMSR